MRSTRRPYDQSNGSKNTRLQAQAPDFTRPSVLHLIVIATLIISLVSWCYAPAVVNGFHGDDFLHVHWLTLAANHPSMLWDNFTGPWLGSTDVKFYRPLISVIFWIEHQLWGFNAVGYHLTNVGFHLSGVLCLLFIGKRLALLAGFDEKASRTVGILAATLWGIHPLNAEVVAWVTGRVDATVTAFSLGCLLAYLKWRESKKPATLAIGLTLFILALLCKEMAVILPPLFVCLDLMFHDGSKFGRLRSLPFWLVLSGYFMVRQLTMGTMIGAYDNTLDTDWRLLWKRFKGGLPFLFSPFNLNIFQRTDVVVRVWNCVFATILGLGLVQLVATRARHWRLHAFCILWFGLALLPVYKVFAVAQNLESSRYAYSAVLPLCLLLSVLATPTLKLRWLAGLQGALVITLGGIAAFALHTHATVWGDAGKISTRIANQIYQLVKDRSVRPTVLMMGLPDNINGAYVMRNALPGMVTPPYFPKELAMARNLDRFCALYPFALFRDSWAEGTDATVVCWNDEKKQLEQAKITASSWAEKKSVLPLQNVKVGGGTGRLTDRGLDINALQKYTILDLRDLNAECSAIDFVQVTLKNCHENLEPSTMTYVNHLHPNAYPTWSSTVRPTVVSVAPNVVRMMFPLRQHPEWVLGEKCTELVFGIPASDYSVMSIEATTAANVIPRVSLPTTAVESSSLSLGAQPAEVSVADRGARSLVLEVSPRGQYFEKQYASTPRAQSVLKHFKPNQKMLLDQTMFDAGMYQARVWWAGTNGQPEGLSSDHFNIVVPSGTR